MALKFGCWDNEEDYLKACRAEDEWDAKGPWDNEIDDYEEEEDEEVPALKCYWLMNHEPTEEQMKELEKRLGMDVLVTPNGEFKKIWAHVPTDKHLPEDWTKRVQAFFDDLNIENEDFAVVQGEMTATFAVVSWLKSLGCPVYSAVTERVSKEVVNPDGTVTKTSEFKHVCFRQYESFEEMRRYDKK